MPLAGNLIPQTILDTSYFKHAFRFSPGGKFVAYASGESNGTEIYIASFPSFLSRRQISKAGGQFPMWRSDGREILFPALDGTIMSAEIRTGSKIEVGILQALFKPPMTSIRRGQGLYIRRIASTGDGKRFLVLESKESSRPSEFMEVLNWAEELKP